MTRIQLIGQEDLTPSPVLGGKGKNLQLLALGGFPVPRGFVVTGDAYSEYLAESGLYGSIAETISQLDSERRNLKAGAAAIRNMFSPGFLRNDLKEEMLGAYHSIGGGLVAVRSSASSEDLPGASFAGLHDTYLNVEGDNNLLASVLKCWASLWNDRAMTYREKRGFDHLKSTMCVVVQRMVPSEVSGVMFTVNPTGTLDQLLIESVFGLGESLVSGRATPDRYLVGRHTGEITSLGLESKETTITPVGEEATPEARRATASLSEKQIKELSGLGLRVEEYFGSPQDIEWAISDKVFVLQSRPVTAVSEKKEINELVEQEIRRLDKLAGGRPVVWNRQAWMEVLPNPPPMTFAIYSDLLSKWWPTLEQLFRISYIGEGDFPVEDYIELICGRLFMNMTGIWNLFTRYVPVEVCPGAMEGFLWEGMNVKWSWGKLNARFFFGFPGLIAILAKGYVSFLLKRRNYDRIYYEVDLPRYLDLVARERLVDLASLPGEEVLRKTMEWIRCFTDRAFRYHLECETFTWTLPVVTWQMKRLFGSRGDEMMNRLLKGLGGNINVETNMDMWKLSRDEMTLHDFIDKYGYRTAFEADFANSRWREDPRFVLRVADGLRCSRGIDPAAQFEAQRRDRIEAEAELDARVPYTTIRRLLRPFRSGMRREIRYLQRYFPMRESTKVFAFMFVELVRSGLLELGRRSGLGDDVFYLLPDELRDLVDGHDLAGVVSERKRSRTLLLKADVPVVVRSDRLEDIANPPQPRSANVLRGIAVSSGIAEGTVRVVRDPGETEALEDGQILVAPAIDPAWSPLFLNAGGLVMDVGGSLSHGSIIAREYGIPAVVGVADATRIIKNGQLIRVDGNAGRVFVLGEAADRGDG
ncbi:MAG: hypothetical protein KKF41_06100 [Actinobacteria bacterium]|nr:hypothetical protein [Actinomycetota bacterium]MBU2687136.1 hypothetical protein [Actinomycetota bacterium]